MTASARFIEMLKDALSGAGPVAFRRMFGGAGVYADGVMFGIVEGDALYLKADERTRQAFEDEGQTPFTYQGATRRIALSYWHAPERLYDDPDEMAHWVRRAIGAAGRLAEAKGRKHPAGARAGPARKEPRATGTKPRKTARPPRRAKRPAR